MKDKEIARYYTLANNLDHYSNWIILGTGITLFDWERKIKQLFDRHRGHPANAVTMYCTTIYQTETGYTKETTDIVAKWTYKTMEILAERWMK